MALTTTQKVSWFLGVAASLTAIGTGIYWVNESKRRKEQEEAEERELFYPPDETAGSSISVQEAQRRANNIFTAMDGPGTDEMAIYRAQNLINASALKLLYNTFGIRDGENMGQWFMGDLDSGEMTIVRAQWQNRGLQPPF